MAELAAMPSLRLMPRTTVLAALDHGIHAAVERVSDHLPDPLSGKPRQSLWRIYAKRAILCAGAIERPITFADNDRPGIHLAGALRAYANRRWADAGKHVAVFTNNDNLLWTVINPRSQEVDVVAIFDTREAGPTLPGIEHLRHAEVIGTEGRLGLTAITVRPAPAASPAAPWAFRAAGTPSWR